MKAYTLEIAAYIFLTNTLRYQKPCYEYKIINKSPSNNLVVKQPSKHFLCVKLSTYPSMDLSSFDSSAKKTKKKIVKKKLADINQTFQTVQKTS